MLYLRGSELSPEDQKRVLAAFVHRYTKEHIPDWAKDKRTTYRVHFESDADWLANTLFPVNKKGQWAYKSRFCESHPTWPDNPEMRTAIPITLDVTNSIMAENEMRSTRSVK